MNFATLARAAPQYWTWGGKATNGDHLSDVVEGLSRITTDEDGSGRALAPFQQKVHIVWQTQYQGPGTHIVIPNQTTDNIDWISGHTFFVKQVGYSDRYWYFNGAEVVVSNTNRSRFRVTINDTTRQDPNKEYVMIGSDKIKIHSICDGGRCLLGKSPGYADDNDHALIRHRGSTMLDIDFSFSAFKRNFKTGALVAGHREVRYTQKQDNDAFECC